jgi:type IV pilus assembly protein PilX
MVAMKKICIGTRKRQQGVVLVVALFFLVVMTVLGLSLAGSTTSEEKIARNFRDQDVAYAAAEAALRDAEMAITGMWQWPAILIDPLSFNPACSGGWCDAAAAQPVDASDFYGSSVPGSNSVAIGTVTGSPSVQGVANQPRYLVEYVQAGVGAATTSKYVYRITAQAQGRSPDTRVVLQEVFRPHELDSQ